MSQLRRTTLVDDLDGSEATETVTFAIDGASYEIDLSAENAVTIRSQLAKYVRAARPATVTGAKAATVAGEVESVQIATVPIESVSTTTASNGRADTARASFATSRRVTSNGHPNANGRATTNGHSSRPVAPPSQAALRAWARARGIYVPARGRISNAVFDEFLAAHRGV